MEPQANTRDALLGQLAGRRVFFIDRDGTLSLEGQALPGARAFIEALHARGKAFYVLTNNSSQTAAQHHQRLAAMGLEMDRENVLVSLDSMLDYLASHDLRDLYLMASQEVRAYVAGRGFEVDAAQPRALALTYDTELTYDKLVRATRLLQAGIPYFASHIDIVCPTQDGPVPDIGTVIASLEMTTGRVPLRHFGKPAPAMIAPVLARHGWSMADAVMVGDRLYTDIALAEGSEMLSVLVLSGETTRDDLVGSSHTPDLVLDDVAALIPYL